MTSIKEYEETEVLIGRLLDSNILQIIEDSNLKQISLKEKYTRKNKNVVLIKTKQNETRIPICNNKIIDNKIIIATEIIKLRYQSEHTATGIVIIDDTEYSIEIEGTYNPNWYPVFTIEEADIEDETKPKLKITQII